MAVVSPAREYPHLCGSLILFRVDSLIQSRDHTSPTDPLLEMAGPSGSSVSLGAMLVVLVSFVSWMEMALGRKMSNKRPLPYSLPFSDHESGSNPESTALPEGLVDTIPDPSDSKNESSAAVAAQERTFGGTLITSVQETLKGEEDTIGEAENVAVYVSALALFLAMHSLICTFIQGV